MGLLVRQPMLMGGQISEHMFVPSGGYCLNKAMIGFLHSLGVSRYTLKTILCINSWLDCNNQYCIYQAQDIP